MIIAKIALKSLLNRKTTTLLTILSVALSVLLLLGIERLRTGARQSFESTISGVDLIVGARSGPVNLLLYSVFRIGNATNNISFDSYEQFANHELVEWSIPISLGDSHRGFRVVGTNTDYFHHYKYSGKRQLEFREGRPFEELFEVVLGAEVARKLNYKLDTQITLSHGTASVSFQDHADKPFKVVGVLASTGTPVDKSVHVSLEAVRALHVDWTDGAPPQPGKEISPQELEQTELRPSDITAFFVKLKSRISVFELQRAINDFPREPLMAILPGVSLSELWQTLGTAENALFAVSLLVFVVSLISMTIALIATLNERRREMAIFRSLGAQRKFVFSMLIVESSFLSLAGITLGILLLYVGLLLTRPLLENKLGLTLGLMTPTTTDAVFLASIFIGSLLAGILPAWRAYKNSLADGLIVRN